MSRGISTNISLQGKAACLATAGIKYALRYYSKPGSSKAIKPAEADALAAVGIVLGVVYQETARSIGEFTRAKAQSHATNAWNSAQAIKQPEGSAIYFAVDYDASVSDLQGVILSYFNEVENTIAQLAGGRNPYHLGVYGSGLTCRFLKANCPAVRYTWLSLSKGWTDSGTYNEWDINQRWGEEVLCGLTPVFVSGGVLHDGDYEYNDDDGEFGGFLPGVEVVRGIPVGAAITPAKIPEIKGIEFEMELGGAGALRSGTLTVLGARRGVIFQGIATSGRPGFQDAGNQWDSGRGPLPASISYTVDTDQIMPESDGHLGVRFSVAPDTVRNSATGTSRGGFSIHGPEPDAGTSGGISVLHANDFTELRRLLAETAAAGTISLPLKVIYSGGVLDLTNAGLKTLGAVFSMKLRDQSKMIYGTFEITGPDGKSLYAGVATSGLQGHQHPGDFWEVGRGVVPPTGDDRFIITAVYATDAPMGRRYQITPEKVWNADHTKSRSAFRVHFDGGVPGSAGCIVTPSRDDYDKIIALFAALNAKGISKIPLELNYT
jgi:hypothetical protein